MTRPNRIDVADMLEVFGNDVGREAAAELRQLRTVVQALASLREGLENGSSAAEHAAANLAAKAAALVAQEMEAV